MYLDHYISDCMVDGMSTTEVLNELTEQFKIKIVESETIDGKPLYCLNYDQIESPRFNLVVDDCRGIILDRDLNVVCRPFTRFYNYGECERNDTIFDLSSMRVYEKVDGSLMKLYNYDGRWYVGSRGTCFATGEMPASDITFNEMFHKVIGFEPYELTQICNEHLSKNKTYLFEMATPFNRVVTKYPELRMDLLAIRSNLSCDYDSYTEMVRVATALSESGCYVGLPKTYDFDKFEEIVSANLIPTQNLDEGYIAVDGRGQRIKFKSPAYIRAHRMRSNKGLPTTKNIVNLVVENEHHEYLAIFPEDSKFFDPVIEEMERVLYEVYELWDNTHDIVSQREFAYAVKEHPLSGILFTARKLGIAPETMNKTEILKKYLIQELDGQIKYRL